MTLQTQRLHKTKFNPSLFVTPEPIEFESIDSKFTIHAQLFVPTNVKPDSPAVIFTHGGGKQKREREREFVCTKKIMMTNFPKAKKELYVLFFLKNYMNHGSYCFRK